MNDDYEAFIKEVKEKYPLCEVIPTRYGCEVWDGEELVDEIDYESDPFAEQKVRY